jgi:hypothetical protein
MSSFTMENLFSRMKSFTSTTTLTFVLLSGLAACSSRNGAISDINTKEGDLSSLDSQDDSGESLEMTSIDQTSQMDSMSSLPVKQSKKKFSKKSYKSEFNMRHWGGKLHTQYSPDMKEWTVARGESLSLIAEGVFGNKNSLNKLLALNPQIVDPNVLSVGQVLTLPFVAQDAQAEEVAKTTPVDTTTAQLNTVNKAKEDSSLTVVSNAPTAEATANMGDALVTPPADAQVAQGAMETVPVVAAPAAPSVDNSALASDTASNVEASAGTSAIVQKVSKVSKKGNLKTGLMVGAIGFLVLSAIVFMLSRKKA